MIRYQKKIEDQKKESLKKALKKKDYDTIKAANSLLEGALAIQKRSKRKKE